MRKLFLLLAMSAIAAFAADVTGTWKGNIETPGGSFENTIVLKADGAKLTGALQGGPGGDMKIEEGKVDGDKISFVVNMEFGKLSYSGTVSGDEMKLKIQMGDGGMGPMEMTAKRAK